MGSVLPRRERGGRRLLCGQGCGWYGATSSTRFPTCLSVLLFAGLSSSPSSAQRRVPASHPSQKRGLAPSAHRSESKESKDPSEVVGVIKPQQHGLWARMDQLLLADGSKDHDYLEGCRVFFVGMDAELYSRCLQLVPLLPASSVCIRSLCFYSCCCWCASYAHSPRTGSCWWRHALSDVS